MNPIWKNILNTQLGSVQLFSSIIRWLSTLHCLSLRKLLDANTPVLLVFGSLRKFLLKMFFSNKAFCSVLIILSVIALFYFFCDGNNFETISHEEVFYLTVRNNQAPLK